MPNNQSLETLMSLKRSFQDKSSDNHENKTIHETTINNKKTYEVSMATTSIVNLPSALFDNEKNTLGEPIDDNDGSVETINDEAKKNNINSWNENILNSELNTHESNLNDSKDLQKNNCLINESVLNSVLDDTSVHTVDDNDTKEENDNTKGDRSELSKLLDKNSNVKLNMPKSVQINFPLNENNSMINKPILEDVVLINETSDFGDDIESSDDSCDLISDESSDEEADQKLVYDQLIGASQILDIVDLTCDDELRHSPSTSNQSLKFRHVCIPDKNLIVVKLIKAEVEDFCFVKNSNISSKVETVPGSIKFTPIQLPEGGLPLAPPYIPKYMVLALPDEIPQPPPAPILYLNSSSSGSKQLKLFWNVIHDSARWDRKPKIKRFQLICYQESPEKCMKMEVIDLPGLTTPMSCLISKFKPNHKYYFTMRAIDHFYHSGPSSSPPICVHVDYI